MIEFRAQVEADEKEFAALIEGEESADIGRQIVAWHLLEAMFNEIDGFEHIDVDALMELFDSMPFPVLQAHF